MKTSENGPILQCSDKKHNQKIDILYHFHAIMLMAFKFYELSGHCGYCGGSSCSSVLKRTSKKKGRKHFKVESNCKYFIQLAKTPKKFTRNVRCTNHIMNCRLCSETSVWKYDLSHHFAEHHEGCDLLEDEVVSKEELGYILSKLV